MNHYVISEDDISLIKVSLLHTKRYCVSTPDTEADFRNVLEILDGLEALP